MTRGLERGRKVKAHQMNEGKCMCACAGDTRALRKYSDHRHVCARRSGSHFNHHTTEDDSPPTDGLSEKPGCNWSNSPSSRASARPSLLHSSSSFFSQTRAQSSGHWETVSFLRWWLQLVHVYRKLACRVSCMFQ